MSKEHPPLGCDEVKRLLKNLGFTPQLKKSGTSHEYWIGQLRGKFRKVTVDCPQAPFTQNLISWMAYQAGVTKKEFYQALDPTKAKEIASKK